MSLLDGIEHKSQNIIYDDSSEVTVSEIINLPVVEWLPCSRRAKRFVPINSTPATIKTRKNPSIQFYQSSEHSIKAYADDATLISDCLETHTRVLQELDRKAIDWTFLLSLQNVCHICSMALATVTTFWR